jgi:predicted ATPase
MFLRVVRFVNWPDKPVYPFNLPAFQGSHQLDLSHFITFFVGENGSGKSTLLEAIAIQSGFNAEGGSKGNQFSTAQTESGLFKHLKLGWMPKVTEGFFFRAESFFNFASHIDDAAKEPLTPDPYEAYGGRSLHEQSHGESFLNLFTRRLSSRRPALYLLDEPEAALSPARQLALLRVLHDHEESGRSQFIIATHSPILLGYPGATLLSFDGGSIEPISYEDTSHFIITRHFLNSPEPMLRELFKDE